MCGPTRCGSSPWVPPSPRQQSISVWLRTTLDDWKSSGTVSASSLTTGSQMQGLWVVSGFPMKDSFAGTHIRWNCEWCLAFPWKTPLLVHLLGVNLNKKTTLIRDCPNCRARFCSLLYVSSCVNEPFMKVPSQRPWLRYPVLHPTPTVRPCFCILWCISM